MRTLVVGVIGSFLLISGTLAGVGGLGLQLANPCTTTYSLSVQPADSASTPPNQTIAFESMTDYQQNMVENAVENDSRLTGKSRTALEPLTNPVIEINGERYVATINKHPCQSAYTELTLGGFASALLGAFLTMYAVVVWQLS